MDDVFVTYSYANAAWLSFQATPMMISPTLLVTFLASEMHQITPLEEYLCRSMAMSLYALVLLNLGLAGVFTASDGLETDSRQTKNIYAPATLIITTIYHGSAGFYAYGHYISLQRSAFMLGAIGSGILAAMGVWCILFGSDKRTSKRTGADKRTSGWPFGNIEADKKRAGKKTR